MLKTPRRAARRVDRSYEVPSSVVITPRHAARRVQQQPESADVNASRAATE